MLKKVKQTVLLSVILTTLSCSALGFTLGLIRGCSAAEKKGGQDSRLEDLHQQNEKTYENVKNEVLSLYEEGVFSSIVEHDASAKQFFETLKAERDRK